VNEQGFLGLKSLLGIESSLQGSVCRVLETDNFGAWISIDDDPRRILGLPWHYVRTIELEKEMLGPVQPGERKFGIGFSD
jgi:hypothetical protein